LNSHWQHEQFLQLIKAAAPELNKAKRIALYDQADRILERESPTIGLWYFTDYWMRKPWLKDLQHTRILGFFWLRDAVILAH